MAVLERSAEWVTRAKAAGKLRIPIAAILLTLFGVGFLLPLLGYAVAGSYTRYVTDDFALARDCARFGVWGDLRHYYLTWTGRYSFLLLIGAQEKYLPARIGFFPPLFLLLWVSGLWAAFHQICRPAAAWTLAVVLPGLTLLLTPDLKQSLYFEASALTYIPPLVALSWEAAFFLALSRCAGPSGPSAWACALLLPFVSAGFSEMLAIVQVPLLLLLFGLLPRHRGVVLVALFSSLAGLAVLFFAPGNAVREAYCPPREALGLVAAQSAQDTAAFLARGFSFGVPDVFDLAQWHGLLPAMVAALSVGFLAGWHSRPALLWKNIVWPLCLITFACLASLYLCFLPGRYGGSNMIPDRAQIVPCFLLTGAVLCAGLWIGPCAAQSLALRQGPGKRRLKWIGLGICLWLLWNVPIPEGAAARQSIGMMQTFASQWDAKNALYSESARRHKDIEIVSLDPFDGTNGSRGRQLWWIGAEHDYYHLPGVLSSPPPASPPSLHRPYIPGQVSPAP